MSHAVAPGLRSCCIVLLVALAGLAPAWAWSPRVAVVDSAQSRIGFSLRTRWGQSLEGRFPVHRGEVEVLPDGRRQVSLVLSAREVEIVGHPAYTRITRGRGFFDAERHPEVGFVSQPYPESLVRDGGVLAGRLRIRGVERSELFTIAPSECARPGLDCDVVASGNVRRSDYGVDRWLFAIADEVRFTLRIRTRGGTP